MRVLLQKSQTTFTSKIFLDSGAFSAWRLNKPVNLQEYCDFLDQNKDWVYVYAALDDIRPGDPEAAAAQSFENLVYMRKRGLNPIPVYHVSESLDWLKRMLDLGCDYIGLSATSIAARGSVDDWYALAWSYLVTASGDPIVKVHAFGEARKSVLLKFPWASADASTWLVGQRHGTIMFSDGTKLSHRHKISEQRSSVDIEMLDGLDVGLFDEMVDKFKIKRSAFDDRKSLQSMLARSYINAMGFMEIEDEVNASRPIKFMPRGGLFSTPDTSKYPEVDIDMFRFYLAIGSNSTSLPVFNACKCQHLLASYFYVNKLNTERFKTFTTDSLKVAMQPPHDTYHNILMEIICA